MSDPILQRLLLWQGPGRAWFLGYDGTYSLPRHTVRLAGRGQLVQVTAADFDLDVEVTAELLVTEALRRWEAGEGVV